MGAFNNIVIQNMDDLLKKQEMIKNICGNLEFKGTTPTGLTMKDTKKNQLVEVVLVKSKFICSQCDKEFCNHKIFALLHTKIGYLENQSG